MRRGLLLLAALACAAFMFAAAAAPSPAATKTTGSSPVVLRSGMSGQRVKNLQWLLAGHDPSVFRSIKTFRHAPNGVFGKRTANAVWNMKWRLGYPKDALHHGRGFVAGPRLFRILLGKERRPLAWIAVAAKRQARLAHPTPTLSVCQQRVISYARSQLGVHEVPWGSNWGWNVPMYLRASGIFYPAPWCMAFAQWAFQKAGAQTIAGRSASVFFVRQWGYQHGYLRAIPTPGSVVLFLYSQGHAGIVERVYRTHGVVTAYDTIEGNTSNGVFRRHYPISHYAVTFLYVPGCSR